MFLRAAYNYDTDEASRESALECKDKSLTHQSFADEADINSIIDRFGVGYKQPDVDAVTFGDFTDITDFRGAMEALRKGREAFMTLDAKVRASFGNDPQAFVAFCSDDNNYDRAVEMGIMMPELVIQRRKALDAKRQQEAAAEQEKRDSLVREAAALLRKEQLGT